MNQGEIGRTLDGLGIDAAGLRTVPVEGAPEVVLAFDVPSTSWFATWQLLRDAVRELALWPLATCTWGGPLDEITRWNMQGPDGLDVTPSAIIARVPSLDVDSVLDAERSRQRERGQLSDADLTWMLDDAAVNGVELARLYRELGPTPDFLDVERWLLDIELARDLPDNPGHNDGYLTWFVPDAVVMLLLPIAAAWQSGAFVGGYDWGHPHTDLRTALLRRWHDRHGAEVAAN